MKYKQYKKEVDFYILVYNINGKMIAEIPIRQQKEMYGGAHKLMPPSNIFITEEGIVYEMYANKKGVHIFKWKL